MLKPSLTANNTKKKKKKKQEFTYGLGTPLFLLIIMGRLTN